MGFNRRYLSIDRCIHALQNSSLKELYGKSDMLIFEDQQSSEIYEYYKTGKSDSEIAKIYNIERTNTENN